MPFQHGLSHKKNSLYTAIAIYALTGFHSCQKLRQFHGKESSKNSSSEQKNDKAESNKLPSGWTYFQAKTNSIYDTTEAQGKLEATEKVEIRADKRMRIGPAKYKVGDPVKRGDVIFVVDTKDFEQKKIESQERVAQLNVDIKSSKAQFAFAAKQLERKTSLADKGIVAQKDLDEAQKAFVAAESDLKTKELELRKAERELANATETVSSANVVSPINGIVASVSPGGDEIGQGQSLATIANPAQLGVSILTDETKVTKFKVGQIVQVSLDAEPDAMIDGSVKNIEATAGQKGAVNQYKIFIVIPASLISSMKLRDGYTARIRAVFSGKDKALVIPRSAVKRNGKDTYALVADSKNGTPSAKAIKLGISTDLETEVLEGLKEGLFVAVPTSRQPEEKP